MGFFRNVKAWIRNESCYTVRTKDGKALLSICGESGSARFTTPHVSILVDALEKDFGTALSPAFAEAYRQAAEHGDEDLAQEIHGLRQIICALDG